MNILIRNALIIPMTKRNYSYKGNLYIKEGKISDGKDFKADKIIDASHMIAMPSLVNAHTHAAMELMRNYKDTAPDLMSWLSQIFPIEARLTDEDIYWASKLATAEMISTGCTVFNDMYFMQENTIKATLESGIRGSIGLTLFGDIDDTKQRISKFDEFLPKYSQEDLITFMIAPHAIYTTTAASYLYAHDWIKERHLRMHTHMSETQTEVKDCLTQHKTTPLMYLEKEGALEDINVVLAHGVYLTNDEVKLCKERDFSIVHNPSSNCKLASGIAPVSKFRKAGITMALGTDGSSSNNNLDMFEEMHVAALLSSVSTMDPIANTPYDILSMATTGGAKALGLADKIGTLEEGKDADIILVDTHKPHLTPLNDPFSALVFAAQGSDVDTVLCRGKILMENRNFTTINVNEIMKQTEACWASIQNRK
ncbi:MAG: amidohydrolase [Spirochaetia bacterium]|jgi:5-methylthioadenosine/S-adenosylhomocysteine deaminase|nr:amidohydrolase [Spirochaetia bacterium]